MESSELDFDEVPAIKALGSLFNLTQVFLWDDSSAATKETIPGSLHEEETIDDTELSTQLSALGLPTSFRTSKVRKNGMVKCKTKNTNQRHSHGHEENEVNTEKVGYVSGEDDFLENLTSSITCSSMEEPGSRGFSSIASDHNLISYATLDSESSEVLDHDGDSEIWASYWDSFYNRYYFYHNRTKETTWDPPPGMEHLAFGEVIDKSNEIIGDTVENLGSQCSIENNSFEESKKDYHSLEQISDESCLSFELVGENLQNSTNISTLNFSLENLNGAKEIEKSCSDESSSNLLQEYLDRGEIEKVEEKEIRDIIQSSNDCTIHEMETEDVWVIKKQKNKAKKRTRLNWKSSIGSGELQFQGILEECIPEEKGLIEERSPSISKYWCQRYQLFSKYDHGIKMDEEGWFSATPEPIAKHHAFRCGDGVVVDCFTGVGGNAIQFAQRSKHVIAIDIDPKKIEYAQHNAAIYGVSDQIDFVVGDSFVLAPKLKADTVFLSPPWGGPNYLKATTYDINTMLKPHGGNILFNVAKGIASKVVMFLPRTVDFNQLAEFSLSADPPWSLEVERNFLNGKLKAITAYFTNISLENRQNFLESEADNKRL